jgi:hypothetical protein
MELQQEQKRYLFRAWGRALVDWEPWSGGARRALAPVLVLFGPVRLANGSRWLQSLRPALYCRACRTSGGLRTNHQPEGG